MLNSATKLEPVSPPDPRRLIEDMAATVHLYDETRRSGRPINPSAAMLAIVGESYLNDGARIEAFGMLRQPGFDEIADAWNFPVEPLRVTLSYFLAGVTLARSDVCVRFTRDGELDWVACLRWLVLHGIFELRLWPFLSPAFITALRSDTVRLHGYRISPLELCVIQERPELLKAAGGVPDAAFRAWFSQWFCGAGLQEYHLFWAITRGDLRQAGQGGLSALPYARGRSPTLRRIGGESGAGASNKHSLLLEGRFVPLKPDYPCVFLDFTHPDTKRWIEGSAIARPAPLGGIDIVGSKFSLQLPTGRYSDHAFAVLRLSFLPAIDPALSVAVEIDGAGEWEWPASELKHGLIIIPFAFRRRDPCLRLFFRGRGMPMQGITGPVSYYGALCGIQLWNTVG